MANAEGFRRTEGYNNPTNTIQGTVKSEVHPIIFRCLFVHSPLQDWQWDGQAEYRRPRNREAASLFLKAGENSTINYVLPMFVGPDGYEPVLEVILDTVTLTSSMDDYQLLSAESCSVRSETCE